MKKKVLLFIMLGSFLLFSLFIIKKNNQIIDESNNNRKEIKYLTDKMMTQVYYSGYYKFPETYMLQSIKGESKLISDVFTSKFTKVLYINLSHCDSCIDAYIERINEDYKKNPETKYVILSKNFNLRELILMKKEKNILGEIFLIKDSGLSFFEKMDKALFPFYFTVDNNLEISNVFFPDKSEYDIDEIYFSRLNNKD